MHQKEGSYKRPQTVGEIVDEKKGKRTKRRQNEALNAHKSAEERKKKGEQVMSGDFVTT